MSRSRKLHQHITQMEEIRTILNSMKNLSFIELHKLARFQIIQGQAVVNIENAAADFLRFYPCLPSIDNSTRICILIGTERGFCGDFNEQLIDNITTADYSGMIAIGSRLHNKLDNSILEVITKLPGANVAEEVPAILNQLIDTIGSLHHAHNSFTLTVIYHESNQINQTQVLPPFLQKNQVSTHFVCPPELNLTPVEFIAELIDQYLFAVLHEIFYLSLMAENQRRLQHLEGAVQHLNDEMKGLRRKSQIYRQEEITEEIEVILLNAENP
jgi:F-type H+-transporting ATPase subunit gamma